MNGETTSTLHAAMATMPPELAAALVEAQAQVGYVAKEGHNKFAHYDYATAESMIDAARRHLNAAGLFLLSFWHFETDTSLARERDTEDGRKLTVGPIGRVVVDYVLGHKSGASIAFTTSTPVVPEKGRPADKAELAALTANIGYTVRHLLMIPRGDDPGTGVDERNDGPTEEATPSPRREMYAAKPAETANAEDVPFLTSDEHAQAAEERAARKDSRGEATAPDPWVDVVKGAIKSIGEMGAVGEIAAGIKGSEDLGMTEPAINAVRRAAVRRMIEVAGSVRELALVTELSKRTKAKDEWLVETTRLYAEKRAALGAS